LKKGIKNWNKSGKFENFLFLGIIVFCFIKCSKKENTSFNIQEVFMETTFEQKRNPEFIEKDGVFFEDTDYIVNKTCSGEFGGSIWFKNKKTGIEYSCNSTCPKSINKIDNKYIITNSLSHMSGSSEIIQIENPKELSIFEKPKPRGKRDGIDFYYAGDKESKSRKGIKVLWKESDILTYLSFYRNKTLYHIMVKKGKTYLTTLVENKLVIVNLISEKEIWSHNVAYKIDENNLTLSLGRINLSNGYLEIKDNNIKLVRYK
jgi:hypothetical protein